MSIIPPSTMCQNVLSFVRQSESFKIPQSEFVCLRISRREQEKADKSWESLLGEQRSEGGVGRGREEKRAKVRDISCLFNRYIESISDQVRPYGICKIIPPESWKPPFMLNRKTFSFRTRGDVLSLPCRQMTSFQTVQHVNYLDGQARQRLIFVENLCRFMSRTGKPLERLPTVGSAQLDLCRLFREVVSRKGMVAVTGGKLWSEVARAMGFEPTFGAALKSHYGKMLFDYERYKHPELSDVKQEENQEEGFEGKEGEEQKKSVEPKKKRKRKLEAEGSPVRLTRGRKTEDEFASPNGKQDEQERRGEGEVVVQEAAEKEEEGCKVEKASEIIVKKEVEEVAGEEIEMKDKFDTPEDKEVSEENKDMVEKEGKVVREEEGTKKGRGEEEDLQIKQEEQKKVKERKENGHAIQKETNKDSKVTEAIARGGWE
eukprot:748439-Hanusia_phi.AAC.2